MPDGFMAQFLADEAVAIFIVQTDGEILHLRRIFITDFHANLATGQFLAEDSRLL